MCVSCGADFTSEAGADKCMSLVTCHGPDQDVSDAAEAALSIERIQLTTDADRLISSNTFKSFVTHVTRPSYVKGESCTELYVRVLTRMSADAEERPADAEDISVDTDNTTDTDNSTDVSTATRSHPSLHLLAVAVAVLVANGNIHA